MTEDSKQASNNGSSDISPTQESSESTPQSQESSTQDMYLDMEPLARIADGKRVTVPKNPHFTRKDVVNAFQSAFELVGGVPRLAIWANQNETEFFKLYARLLPSQSSSALGEANTLRIEFAIPPSPLDAPTPIQGEVVKDNA